MPLDLSQELIKRSVDKSFTNPTYSQVPQEAPQAPSSSSPNWGTIAKMIGLGGTALDEGTTAYAMAKGGQERNPLINWAGNKGVMPLAIGSDIGTYLLAKKFLEKNHPNIFNAVIGGAGAAHMVGGIHNLMNIRKY